jgi:hypothetical protein
MASPEELYSARKMYWRVGRKTGRTIFAQLGPGPGDADWLIGIMDSQDLAAAAVAEHNKALLENTSPLPKLS